MPKPIDIGYISLILTLSLFSCREAGNNHKNRIIKSLQNSLVTSNSQINISIATGLKDLESKAAEPISRERALVWYPKATRIQYSAGQLYNLLELMKLKPEKYATSYYPLLDSIKKFKLDFLSIDASIVETLNDDFNFINSFREISGSDTLETNKRPVSALESNYSPALLTMLQNEILKLTNKAVSYCNIKATVNFCGFEIYETLIGQNSNYFSPGSTLEIWAGVGAFSKSSQPKIEINGQITPITEYGYSDYKIKVNNKPGKYSVPVTINFFNQATGVQEEVSRRIEYTVGKPCDQ